MTERGKPLIRRHREFGLVLGGILMAVGLVPLLRSHEPRSWAVALGLAVWLAAAAYPPLMKLPYRFMLKFGHVMGIINAKVILSVFYYLVVTPIGLVMRAAGSSPIKRGYDRDAASYWEKREGGVTPESMERMF